MQNLTQKQKREILESEMKQDFQETITNNHKWKHYLSDKHCFKQDSQP